MMRLPHLCKNRHAAISLICHCGKIFFHVFKTPAIARGETFVGLLLVAALLHGCAARQEVETVPAPERGTISSLDSEFSPGERKALEAKKEIDKNVPPAEMGDVALQYKHYLRKGRKTMCAISKRSEPYLAYARQVFRERGMPEELANLAILESGFKADAVSHAGAAGAWQFMPQTGLKYGLSQDWWQDERMDTYRATEAAADYLQKLYNDFGDWPTAIAAYNAGEGKMSRAMQGTGGKDFFEAKAKNHVLDEKAQLREETRQYVPKFMAISKIMRNLPELGFEDVDPDSAEPVRRMKAYPGMDLRAFSEACNLNWADFYRHNQHHKRNITCTERETFIYVPERAHKKAEEYLCTSKTFSYAGWKPLKVQANGDSLEKISKRANIPLARLKAANPGMGKLKSGQIVLAPATVNMAVPSKTSRSVASTKVSAGSAAASVASHTIKTNETLFSIARKYNVEVGMLMAHNGIDNPARLRAGQSLAIPGRRSGSRQGQKERQAKQPVVYKVRDKDNLWKIARKHNISVDDLKRWNKVDEKSLKSGSTIIVSR